jgi:uncharacterized membrane protein YfcA
MFIFTSGMIALFIDTTRIYQYIAGGTRIPRDMALTLVILIPLSLGGAYVAKRIVHKVPQNLFRLIIASFLGLVALKFIFLP